MTVKTWTRGDDLSELLRRSEMQGYGFVRRLVDEMSNGTNRFDGEGEALFVAESEGRICGVCGLNKDGLSGRDNTSRLRHLYIQPECRGEGVGTALVTACIAKAAQHSDLLVLRTHCPDAAAFYRKLGFKPSELDGATHEKPLGV